MKKTFFILLFIFLAQYSRAQFVFIPDSNFRDYIKNTIDSNAISGNNLDTTNINIVSLKYLQLDFFSNLIADLTGIQYFDSLETLKINFLNLAALPALPPQLRHLEAQGNAFSSLPDLPASLQILDVAFNSLAGLPVLPVSLSYLNASTNFLSTLPPLAGSLHYLNAANNQITHIDSFPDQLEYIILWGNQLDSLPAVPSSVQELNVSDNDLTFLPPLPSQLLRLFCSMNPLNSFPLLAEGLQFLDCVNTVSCLPPLPNSLINLNFDGCLSNHPASMTEFYPLCNAEVVLVEVPDSAAVCNDTLKFADNFTTYLWNTGSTSSVLPGICRGVFTATLTDSAGCIYTTNIDISDTALHVSAVSNTESSCNRVGICGYVIDVSVSGGTPPYTYKWSDSSGEIDFGMIADSTQDLIHFCLSDILSVDDVKCVVTDAVGRQDSIVKTMFDNVPPEPFFIDIVNPVCPGYSTGYIYLEDDPFTPGGSVFIMETNLDTGEYIYTVPYGNGCEEVYSIHLEHQFDDCSNMYSYAVTPPDSSLCNGTFALVDNVDHGIYNLANIALAFDGLYLEDGSSIPPTELCMNTWYYFFVFDFNIGYFEQDSIYISQPQFATVYPGDANNDNTANNVDLLAIGLAFNETGYARADTTLTWSPKSVQHWMDVFADSTNMCYADVNGNGIVSARDTTGILLNYGLTHFRPALKSSGAEPAVLFAMPDSIESNTFFEVPVLFGDASIPADSVLGVAFTLQFDNAVIDSASVRFVSDSSWLGTPGQDLISIQYRSGSFVDIALTRTDHNVRSGSGSIGRLLLRSNVLTDSAFSSFTSHSVIYTNVSGYYIAGDGSTDSSLFYPAGCILNTQLDISHACYELYGGEAEVSVSAGKSPYNFIWTVLSSVLPVTLTNGISTQDSLPTGTYQVIVSDSAGCSDTLSAYISSQDGDLITATSQNPTCPQICDGWIWLKGDSINGPVFSSSWSTGQTSSIITGMCDGLYSVTVNWGEGCSENRQYLLSDPAPLSYFLSVDTPSCMACDGSITVVAFGGRRPYNYTWTSSTDTSFQAFDSVAMNLCYNNSYEMQITDACLNLFDQGVFFSTCDSTVSINEMALTEVNIYPNPNHGHFTVTNSNVGGRVEIIDAGGRQVYKVEITTKEQEIKLEDTSPGLYILIHYTEKNVSRQMFIVATDPAR